MPVPIPGPPPRALCPRCQGEGLVPDGYDRHGEALERLCPVCRGTGQTPDPKTPKAEADGSSERPRGLADT
jgi:DnaJ-class molecular chaperone